VKVFIKETVGPTLRIYCDEKAYVAWGLQHFAQTWPDSQASDILETQLGLMFGEQSLPLMQT